MRNANCKSTTLYTQSLFSSFPKADPGILINTRFREGVLCSRQSISIKISTGFWPQIACHLLFCYSSSVSQMNMNYRCSIFVFLLFLQCLDLCYFNVNKKMSKYYRLTGKGKQPNMFLRKKKRRNMFYNRFEPQKYDRIKN